MEIGTESRDTWAELSSRMMRPSTSTRKVTAAAESRMRLLVRIRGQPTIGGENLDDLFDRLVRLRLRLAPGGPGHPSWICSGLIGL